MTSELLPEPDTPVTQVIVPRRKLDGEVAQVVVARALHGQRPAVAGAAPRRHRDLERARQVAAGERGRVGDDLGRRALGDDAAAVHAGARAHVDDVVGGEDGVAVVLDDDHRVAEVAQALQRVEQARVVALVQADRRLVEHVEHAAQAGADLRRQADALPLAARQRRGARGRASGSRGRRRAGSAAARASRAAGARRSPPPAPSARAR